MVHIVGTRIKNLRIRVDLSHVVNKLQRRRVLLLVELPLYRLVLHRILDHLVVPLSFVSDFVHTLLENIGTLHFKHLRKYPLALTVELLLTRLRL